MPEPADSSARAPVRLVTPEPTPADLEQAILAVAAPPGGCPRRELWSAVADRLRALRPGTAPPPPDRVLHALGMLIARGEADEAEGRVVATGIGARRAG